MTNYEPVCVETDRHVFRCCKATEAEVGVVGGGVDRSKLLRRREVNRIVETWVVADAALKAVGGGIDLADQLYP